MKMIKVKILKTELEATLLNPNTAHKYERGIENVLKISEEALQCESEAQGIEMQCNAVIDFIDEIFGPGSAKKVLGEETDLFDCLDAWNDITRVYKEQVDPALEKFCRIYRF